MSNDLLPPIERPNGVTPASVMPQQSVTALVLLLNNLIIALAQVAVLPHAILRDIFKQAQRSKLNTDPSLRLMGVWLENFDYHTTSLAGSEAAQSPDANDALAEAQAAAQRIIGRAHAHAASVAAEAQQAASRLAVTPMTAAEIEQLKQNIRNDAENRRGTILAEAGYAKDRILAEAKAEAERIIEAAKATTKRSKKSGSDE